MGGRRLQKFIRYLRELVVNEIFQKIVHVYANEHDSRVVQKVMSIFHYFAWRREGDSNS